MDVRCPQCETLYEFDERQMRGAIATLKCSVCQHLFRIETNVSLGREDHHRWMVRSDASGDVLYFSGFDMLHRWIMEGQVSKRDAISRTGQRWTRLEDIGEFMPIFQVVESIHSLTRGANPAPERERAGTIQQFASSEALRSPSRQPAPSWNGVKAPRQQTPQTQRSAHPRPHLSLSGMTPAATAADELPFAPTATYGAVEHTPAPQPAPQPTAPLHQPAPQPVSQPQLHQPLGRTHTPRSLPAAADAALTPRPSPASEWSLGDHSIATTEESPASISSSGLRVQDTSGKRGVALPIVLVLVLLLVGAGVYSQRETLFKTAEVEPVTPVAPRQEVVEAPTLDLPAATLATDEALQGALDQALEAKQRLEGERLTSGIVAAMSPLHGAVSGAEKQAETQAKRASGGNALKDAQRALDQGDAQRAYDLFYKVLDKEPRNASALTGLGWSLIQLGRYESAAVQFKRAISIDTRNSSAYLGLAKAERSKRNLRGAIKIYEEYLNKFPNEREANIARTQRDKLLQELGE